MTKWLKDSGLHLLASAPMWAYGGVSGWMMANSTAQAFQRFGAVVIVTGILLLGFSAKAIFTEIANRSDETVKKNVPTKYLRFHARELAFSEIFLVVLGTIQSGYGDLFHCWYNDNGWTTC